MEIKPKLNGPEILRVEGINTSDIYTELSWMLPILEKPEKTGAIPLNGELQKENEGIFFSEIYLPKYIDASPAIRLCNEIIKECQSIKFEPSSAFNHLYVTNGFDPLFSAYRNGDYYKAHRDVSNITMLIWVGEHNFTGGDLHFPDFDFTVPFEPNTGLIFPSHYLHEVTKVETEQEGYVRFAVSAFIN